MNTQIPDYLQTPYTNDGRTPFHPIVMQFAARMINKTYEEFMTDYRVLVEANMKCLELFGMDSVSVISDPFRETSGFGARVSFNGDSSPRAEKIISTPEDVINLKIPDIYSNERMTDRLKAAELFREKLGNKFPVVGWVEGPLAEACDLADITGILIQLMTDPQMVTDLMDKCLELGKIFAKAQIDAGANIIGVGDAICSQISPDIYETYVLPRHISLFEHIHSSGGKVKLHICGNTTHLLPYLGKTKADIIDLDWMVSFEEARKHLGPDVWLSGNPDPVSLIQNGTEQEITDNYHSIIKANGGKNNFIYSAGCEITPSTLVEKVKLMRSISK